jgi:MFS family permease
MSTLTEPIPTLETSSASDRRRRIIAIIGASSGNLVEWYDFYAYAFTSIYFASAFFPSGDTTSQLLATAGIFAVGFFMRPLGGWLFGWIADTHGRRISMIISVLMMCAGSLMIAVMPTYQAIGALAPALLRGVRTAGRHWYWLRSQAGRACYIGPGQGSSERWLGRSLQARLPALGRPVRGNGYLTQQSTRVPSPTRATAASSSSAWPMG